jgi:hypothetical protein
MPTPMPTEGWRSESPLAPFCPVISVLCKHRRPRSPNVSHLYLRFKNHEGCLHVQSHCLGGTWFRNMYRKRVIPAAFTYSHCVSLLSYMAYT